MTRKKILIIIGVVIAILVAGYFFDFDFGITPSKFCQNYDGQITASQSVRVSLPCHLQSLVITGAVNQIILLGERNTSASAAMCQTVEGFDKIVDLSGGADAVKVEKDYNADGYNDLSVLFDKGRDMTDIYLYDSVLKKFVWSAGLSKVEPSFDFTIGDTYVKTKHILASNGWEEIIPNLTNPIDSEFPEIANCGSGRDAICNVDFKKCDFARHLNLQNRDGGWLVVGDE